MQYVNIKRTDEYFIPDPVQGQNLGKILQETEILPPSRLRPEGLDFCAVGLRF